MDIIFDMETSDPDDFLTLLLLIGHPQVNLKAVTVTPGNPEQIGLIRRTLNDWFNLDIPVGAHNIQHAKPAVSEWHYEAYGKPQPSTSALPGYEVLLTCCDAQTTLVTGAPLKNIGAAIRQSQATGQSFTVKKLVVQGGFAGEGVVPPEKQLEKFKGLRTCPSFNLNGDPKSVFLALEHAGFGIRYFVSKNVCHGVVYDRAMHEQFAAVRQKHPAFDFIWRGMDIYLQKNPHGKILHDPLAACCAMNEAAGTWAEVEIFREKGEWGSRLASGTNTWIITDYDRDLFLKIFMGSHIS
jgi:inosine-uridine nucleoside N-ribohydrolase